MYYAHFGLKQPPFKITPNTEFFFTGANRGAILDALLYAVTSGEGIVKVVGEVGSGKTMICRMLQTMLPQHIESVYLANPSVAPEDIVYAIAFELQLKIAKNSDRLQVMQQLQTYLLERHAEGKQVVIFVEEAQGMPLATLEEIRLLSNLETKHDKLLQIVLFGQPELDVNLNANHIRQLRERITHSFNLGPLDQQAVGEYLLFRLRAAGYFGPHLFDKKAIAGIASSAQGLVRRVNILADKALLAAFSENVHLVQRKHVQAAINDSEFGAEQVRRTFNKTVLLLLSCLLVSIAAWYAMTKAPHLPWFSAAQVTQTPVANKLVQKTPEQTPVQPAQSQHEYVEKLTQQTTAAETSANTPATLDAQASSSKPDTFVANISQHADAIAHAQATMLPPGLEADNVLQSRLQATQLWLKQQAESTISIQLLGSSNYRQLHRRVTLLAKQLPLEELFVYKTQVKGQPFFALLYGSFDKRQAALQAVERLPQSIKVYDPHLRTVGGILKETNQFQ